MGYRVEFKPSAWREFKKLARSVQERFAPVIDKLAKNPRPQGVESLKGGSGLYRVRMGDYRLIYRIEDRVLLVLVVRIAHRRDVYRDL